jgi:hypothetical protein
MIEDSNFFKDRLELAGPNGRMINRIKAQDRTVDVIRKWQSVSAALKEARAETMTCISARPGKGKGVIFEVMDEERFASLQETIAGQEEQLAALDGAIKTLDNMGPDVWFGELNDKVGMYGRTETTERRQIANMSAAYIQRRANTGKSVEEILAADPEVQRLKALGEKTIRDANELLAELRPRLEELTRILEGVGC